MITTPKKPRRLPFAMTPVIIGNLPQCKNQSSQLSRMVQKPDRYGSPARI
jgi:hypothetical protein